MRLEKLGMKLEEERKGDGQVGKAENSSWWRLSYSPLER